MRMTYVLTLILILAQILKNVNKENEEPGWARIKFITYSIVEIHMICEACFEYPIYNIVWLHMYSQFVWWCLSVHIYIRYMYCDRIAVEAFIFIFYSILYKQPYTYIHTFKTEWIHTHYTANVNYNSNIGYWLYIGPLTSIQQSLPLKIHGWWNDCPCTSGLSPVKSSLASRFSINKCPGCFIVGSQWPCQHHCLHHSSTPPRTTAGLEFGHDWQLGHASLFLQCTTARIPNSTNITLSSLLCDRLSRSNSREITEKPASLHPVNSLLVTYSLAAEEVGHYPFQSEGMQFRRLLKFSQFPWPLLNIYKNTRTFESIAI